MSNQSSTPIQREEKSAAESGSSPPSVAPRPASSHGADVLKPAIVVVVATVALVFVVVHSAGIPLPGLASEPKEKTTAATGPLGVDLVPDQPHMLVVPEPVRISLGIQQRDGQVAIAVARVPTATQPLILPGSTALDPTRLSRIRARFAPAEVIEIGQISDPVTAGKGPTRDRELRPGDFVFKDQLLAAFYSVDVGAKKNDLIDALVQLRLDQDILDRAEKNREAVPEVFLLNARRNVQADRNAEARARNTLKTWGIPDEDIKAVEKEAEDIHKRGGKRDPRTDSDDKKWGRVELRAAADGTIVERNVSLKEVVVDGTTNLFQIAQVDRLIVIANAPEDDLPQLLQLHEDPDKSWWTVRTVGAPESQGLRGSIDEIGYLIDVNQHSAVVKGHIDNSDRRLRAGQYVTATVQLPPPLDVVEIPVGAVVDDGRQCVVFVQPEAGEPQFTMRRVLVTHRFEKTVFVRSLLADGKPGAVAASLATGLPQVVVHGLIQERELLPPGPLRPGERVLTVGVLELKKELEDRESKKNGD
jgi:cobalt-zinc-cadmium efflux system membrane fusion protein